MINYDGRKYACVNCIRGHRSSSCDHTDRVLLQVRRRGRRTGAGRRIAMVPKREMSASPMPLSQGTFSPRDYSIVELKSEERTGRDPTDLEDEVVLTEKYIFIPVGDGLYKREYRQKQEQQCQQEQQEQLNVGEESDPQVANGQGEEEALLPYIDPSLAPTSGPMVIAPMNFDPASLQHETNDLWPNDVELTYAPQCVIPGKCECGDGCMCANCWEHSLSRNSANL